ncbi:aminoglycoside phosphotransferase family protein [Devosia sp.]|uniref:aminoglycoside phosphotransferase family protein n=1 Tax=Devosia sp. TaxID=1871048 RepID=UPI002F038EB9
MSQAHQTPAQTALNRALIRWSLSRVVLLAETPASWIYKVEQNGRNPAVLKQLKPEAGDAEQRGSALQAWYGGEGAATVFDSLGGVIFMEWLDGPTLGDAARAGRDEEATVALAGVVAALHGPRDADPPPLLPLRHWYQPLFDMAAARWPAMSKDLLARAVGVAHLLFDKPAAALPLHGDLAHDNIISSPRGWLAIDPVGLVGDPVFDVAPSFVAPADAAELVVDARRIVRLADIYEARLGYHRKRMLGHAAAHAALSACRQIDVGGPATLQLNALPLLLAAYDQA